MRNLKFLALCFFVCSALVSANLHADEKEDKKNVKIVHKAIVKGDCKQSDHCEVKDGKGQSTTETTNNGKTNDGVQAPEEGTEEIPGRNY